jgi:hypothetical protein
MYCREHYKVLHTLLNSGYGIARSRLHFHLAVKSRRIGASRKKIAMGMLLKRISISLLLMTGMATAIAGPGSDREDHGGGRGARQQQRGEQNRPGRQPDQQQYRHQQGNGGQGASDGSRRPGRLSPEELQALRRQINEAGRDIYIPKR